MLVGRLLLTRLDFPVDWFKTGCLEHTIVKSVDGVRQIYGLVTCMVHGSRRLEDVKSTQTARGDLGLRYPYK